ncbi:MAG: Mur ligase family protein [Microbacteriaceae bacterium]|nr:Mur ligase family protein [Microbacteriaceae bacterium]
METRQGAGRFDSLHSWGSDGWPGLRVAVLGMGLSGFAAADTLVELGAEVLVVADRPDNEREQLLSVIGAEFFIGDDAAQVTKVADFAPDLLVVSPGFAADHPVREWAETAQLPVWGEIELAWRVRDKVHAAEWLLVTGTKGKTTTAQLTAHILRQAGLRAAPVGSNGTPVLDAVRDPAGFDVLVVDISSAQLHDVFSVEPHAAACLNITEEHLDWHSGFAGYAAAKARVFERTKVACVYNRADSATERMVMDADVREGARAVSFGLDVPPRAGFGLVEGILADRGFHADRGSSALEILTLEQLQELGLDQPHTVANILAAAALARACGVAPENIAAAVTEFAESQNQHGDSEAQSVKDAQQGQERSES